jgi:hypothetical protein
MKKRLGICAITLVIAGLLISSVASVPASLEDEKQFACTELDLDVAYVNQEAQLVTAQKNNDMGMNRASTIIIDTEFDDFHPTVTGDASDTFFACFELTLDDTDYFPDFFYSLDGGVMWEESGYFPDSLGAMYPDVDFNENGFYGTFGVSQEDNLGAQWLVIAEDVAAITGAVWDWSDNGFDDFNSMSISCYTMEGEFWNYGGMAATGYNGYQTYDVNGCPFIFYPSSETGGRISWLTNSQDYVNADNAIDEVTGMSYSVWDHETDANMLVRKDNFGVWQGEPPAHPYVGAYSVGDTVTHLTYPSIEANNNEVVIAAQAEGGITCIYSANGMTTTSQSTISATGMYPEVKVTMDGEVFVCSYVKDGGIYRKISEDGGATWTDEQQIEDSDTTDSDEPHDLGVSLGGIFSVWEDDRGGDFDIYFGQALEVTSPELSIEAIKGGIGVKATIKNIGDADATAVDWTLTVKGGLLGMIDVDKSGTEATLAFGSEFKAGSGFMLGIGKITVEVTVTCAEGSSDSDSATGRQILFFSMV